MPCDYAIDAERHMVYSRAWGDITDADLLDHQRRLAADPQFHSDYSQLWDFLDATSFDAVTSGGLMQGAQRHLFGQRSRRAIVVADTSTFGLARMFEAYREMAGGEDQIRVFMSLEDARTWLGISPGHA